MKRVIGNCSDVGVQATTSSKMAKIYEESDQLVSDSMYTTMERIPIAPITKYAKSLITTYMAACMSKNKDVTDFCIYCDVAGIPGFKDMILKVWYKGESNAYIYLCQMKNIDRYIGFDSGQCDFNSFRLNSMKIIDQKYKIALFKDVPTTNIQFWLYSNKFVGTVNGDIKISSSADPNSMYHIKRHEIDKSIIPCNELTSCYVLELKDPSQQDSFFNNFFLFLNQPNSRQIKNNIQKILGYSKERPYKIMSYVYNHAKLINGLTKVLFESEICKNIATTDGNKHNGKPFKVTDFARKFRVGMVVTSLKDLTLRLRDKLNIFEGNISIVLEIDGTQIEDEEYFATLNPHTDLMVLRDTQKWQPPAPPCNLSDDQTDGGNPELKGKKLVALIEMLKYNICNISLLEELDLELLSDMDPDPLVHAIFPDKIFLERVKETCGRYLSEKRQAQGALQLLQLYHKNEEEYYRRYNM